MTQPWRSVLGVVGALAAGAACLGAATSGFRAWTTDEARALAVAERPVPLPDVRLVGADGRPAALADSTRVTILDVFYTECPTVCLALAAGFRQLQGRIASEGLEQRVRLLSVSFDPRHDTPAVLADFAARHAADPRLWQFATVPDTVQLAALLRTVGVRVIPDGRGGLVHNAALHVVDREGRLVAIVPPEAGEEALAIAVEASGPALARAVP